MSKKMLAKINRLRKSGPEFLGMTDLSLEPQRFTMMSVVTSSMPAQRVLRMLMLSLRQQLKAMNAFCLVKFVPTTLERLAILGVGSIRTIIFRSQKSRQKSAE